MAIQDDYIKTAFRLPRDLHNMIQESAEQNGRSMNAEIIARLSIADDAVAMASSLEKIEEVNKNIQALAVQQDQILYRVIERSGEALGIAVSELLKKKGDKKILEFLSKEYMGLRFLIETHILSDQSKIRPVPPETKGT